MVGSDQQKGKLAEDLTNFDDLQVEVRGCKAMQLMSANSQSPGWLNPQWHLGDYREGQNCDTITNSTHEHAMMVGVSPTYFFI